MIETVVDFVWVECCECTIHFSIPVAFYNLRKKDGNSFYCPAGHKQHYSETEITLL